MSDKEAQKRRKQSGWPDAFLIWTIFTGIGSTLTTSRESFGYMFYLAGLTVLFPLAFGLRFRQYRKQKAQAETEEEAQRLFTGIFWRTLGFVLVQLFFMVMLTIYLFR